MAADVSEGQAGATKFRWNGRLQITRSNEIVEIFLEKTVFSVVCGCALTKFLKHFVWQELFFAVTGHNYLLSFENTVRVHSYR